MKKIIMMVSCVILGISLISGPAFNVQADTGQPGSAPAAAIPSYTITTSVNNRAYGTVTPTATVEKGQDLTVTITPAKGYGITNVIVDGKQTGPAFSYTFQNVKAAHTITANFRKTGGYAYIMLDAGHYGKCNRSPVYPSYYESNMNWALHLDLKTELQKYNKVVVGTTRPTETKDRGIYDRGLASAGYDLFLSIHSNACGNPSVDYPLIITQLGNTGDPLAVSFGRTIRKTMGTVQNYRIWQRSNSDGKTEYYGVLRGAKAVGTKGMILEHSFHTNLNATKWLSDQNNLQALAQAEAADIAAYYGLSATGSGVMPPSGTPGLRLSHISYKTIALQWGKAINATDYQIYRATGAKGAYHKIKTISAAAPRKYQNTGLTAGKTYYYKIRACRTSVGQTCYGHFSGRKALKAIPATPVVSGKAGKRSVTLSWKKVPGAGGYRIYRYSAKYQKYLSLKLIKRGSAVTYTNKALQSKTKYGYKVRAYTTVHGKRIYSNYSSRVSKTAL